jgi:hypothetical protein
VERSFDVKRCETHKTRNSLEVRVVGPDGDDGTRWRRYLVLTDLDALGDSDSVAFVSTPNPLALFDSEVLDRALRFIPVLHGRLSSTMRAPRFRELNMMMSVVFVETSTWIMIWPMYTDRISGTKARRPALDDLLRDARRGKFSGATGMGLGSDHTILATLPRSAGRTHRPGIRIYWRVLRS